MFGVGDLSGDIGCQVSASWPHMINLNILSSVSSPVELGKLTHCFQKWCVNSGGDAVSTCHPPQDTPNFASLEVSVVLAFVDCVEFHI